MLFRDDMDVFVCVFVYTYMCVYIYIISFLLGFWVIFNNCIFFTHSLTLSKTHLVLGIYYNQSIQNPRPNTCWFLIMNLVGHGILTFFQTNSVKNFFLHVNALAFKMENCEHDLIFRGESGIAPKVSIFSVAEHLICALKSSNNWKARHVFPSQKTRSFLVAVYIRFLISKQFFLFWALFYNILQIFRVWEFIVELNSAVRLRELKKLGQMPLNW